MTEVWNPDYAAEFRRRRNYLSMLMADKTLIPKAKQHYKNNPVDFIQDWGVTIDPRSAGIDSVKPGYMPMILFPRQIEFIEWCINIMKAKPGTPEAKGVAPKCRGVGLTWLGCQLSVWMILFYSDLVVGWGSDKSESVDKIGDRTTIFSKLNTILENIPPIFTPKLRYIKNLIENLDNGSTIVGKAGDNIGRGGRAFFWWNDEEGHYEHDEMRAAALSETTYHTVGISTPNGTDNLFYRTVDSGVTPVFRFTWDDDPRRTQEQYDNLEAEFKAKGAGWIFAQEYGLSFTGSVDKIVIPQDWVKAAVNLHKDFDFDGYSEIVEAGQDIADGGSDLNSLAIRKGVIVFYSDSWASEPGEVYKSARIAWKKCVELNVDMLKFDNIGVGSQFKHEIDILFNANESIDKFETQGWSAAGSVRNPFKKFAGNIINKDQFANIKAQEWWDLSIRFLKAYRHRKGEKVYPLDEMISLDKDMPNLRKVMTQLSQPTFKLDEKGHIIIVKTPEGKKSPNDADAVLICFAKGKQKDKMGMAL